VRSRLRTLCLATVWVAVLGGGLRAIARYDYGAAPAVAGVGAWPRGTAIHHAADRPTVVMFVHPKCPCTKASIDALTRILTTARERLDAVVVFWKPSDVPAGWERTETWRAVAAIPGVRAIVDVDGAEATRFGAETSGEVLVYGRDGARLFAGGITPSRGQIGASRGAEAIAAIARGEVPPVAETPVYGCPIIVPPEVVAEPENRRVDRM
jgi:hypothetical protein